MRITASGLAVLGMSAALWALQAPAAAPVPVAPGAEVASSNANASQAVPASPQATMPADTVITAPPPTPKDVAEAKHAFSKGTKLRESGKLQAAFEEFETAAHLDPRNLDYLTAREMTRQELVMQAIERGNKAMQEKNEVAAMAEFRRALEFDSTNEFARQRLHDAVWAREIVPNHTIEVTQKTIDVRLSPEMGSKDFHFKGDSRSLLTQVARAYGITATVDDSVPTKQVRFNIEKVNFEQAMEAANQVTKSFWIPLSGSQMYVVADNPQNRRNFERLSIRTFYLNDILTPQELTETVTALLQLLDIRLIQQDASASTITIRAPLRVVDAATELIESIAGGRPQLMLDVRVYQISSSLMRQMGTQLPTSFNLFNLNPALLASLVPGASDLINQLIASGGINQANSQALQALVAQLSQASQNPLLTTPFATFGGGQSLMGVSGTPNIAVNLQVNESDVKSLEHVTLQASQNSPSVLRLGQRYPIVNATFAPIYNSTAISQVVGNGSYTAPFPSFSFEDLGLNMKVTPLIHSNTDVSLVIEMNIRTLAGQGVNGIPIINNREYKGSITLRNEESGVVAGFLSKQDALSLSGWPFLSRVPAVTYGTAMHNKNDNDDELLVVMTPHITRMAPQQSIALQLPSGH